jgi:hypothetical protein
MSGKSDFLFAQPSFWEGMGRLLDFGDFLSEYNTSPTGEIADEIALTMDWQAVYGDLWTSLEEYGRSIGETLTEEQVAVGSGR